jgi:hypothetical protein
MMPHPYFSEQLAADRRQTRLEQATSHRLLRQKSSPSPRRPLTDALKRALQWVTPVSPTPIKTGAGRAPVPQTSASTSSTSS